MVECSVLPQGVNLQQAMRDSIERWVAQGWEAEGDGSYEFCFIRRGGERLLLKHRLHLSTQPIEVG